jgi:hypothetical protein
MKLNKQNIIRIISIILLIGLLVVPKFINKKIDPETNIENKTDIIDIVKAYVNNNKEYFDKYFKYEDNEYRISTYDLINQNIISKDEFEPGYVVFNKNKYEYIKLDKIFTNDYSFKTISTKENDPYDIKSVFSDTEKNYVKVNDKLFRIIGLTNSNELKLISTVKLDDIKEYGLGGDINYFTSTDGMNFGIPSEYKNKGVFNVGFVRSNTNSYEEIIKNEKRNNEYTAKKPRVYASYAMVSLSDIIVNLDDCNYDNLLDLSYEKCNNFMLEELKGSELATTLEDNKIYKVNDEGKLTTTDDLKNIHANYSIYISALSSYTGTGSIDDPFIFEN